MKFVVDTNILMTCFWKDSVANKMLRTAKVALIAPEYALEEINHYKEHIIAKTNITEKEFSKLRQELAIYIDFMPLESYRKHLTEAARISPDPNDADFFALAIAEQAALWSNDKQLQQQDAIQVYTTSDLLKSDSYTDFF